MGSFGRPLGVIGFVRVRWIQSDAPYWSSDSFGLVGFIHAWPGGRRVLFGFVGFTRVRPAGRWVHSGEHLRSSCSFGFVGFIRAHPGGRWIHSGSLGSCMHDLVVIWVGRANLRERLGSFGRVLSVVGLIRALR